MWPFTKRQEAGPVVTHEALLQALQSQAICAKNDGCRELASLCVRCAFALRTHWEEERVQRLQEDVSELDLRQ